MKVINVLDHNGSWAPPGEDDCNGWISQAGLQETVVLRELADQIWGEVSTAASYQGDHWMLLLLDGDKRVRLRWGAWWNEADLAPTIDDILAGR